MTDEPYPTDDPAVVTCGLPYANGDLHIGHLRSLVSADILNRALGVIGQESIYVCGSDMHGAPVALNAAQEGVDPADFAMQWHERFLEVFPEFHIDFDNYGHTDDRTNTDLTVEIVETLIDGGYVYEKEIEVAWDPIEEQALPDRYVEGTCPYCGADARGDECDEGCGRHLEPGEIDDPVSTLTGNPAEYRTRAHKFFRVSEFADVLTNFLDNLEGTDNARNQPRQWIEEGLQDWCITRDMDWGIQYPGEDGEDLVLYVWVDAPIEYISSTIQYAESVGPEAFDWEAPWRGDGDIVHIIGRDIIQHHTIFWPAMLEAAGYNTPRAICAHGFITIQGKGLSTSRNRAIWAQEYLDAGFDADPLRYYLTTTGGMQQDIDFSWQKFGDRLNGELVGTLGNFIYRSLLFAHREYGGTPDVEPSEAVLQRIESAMEEFTEAVNAYNIRAIGMAPIELAQFGNSYIQQHEPWRLLEEDPEAAATVIRDCVQLTRAIAILGAACLPETMSRLWWELGESDELEDQPLEAAIGTPSASFGAPSELFEPVEDDHVHELSDALAERMAPAEEESDEEEPGRIDFETFQQVDMRVGEILSAAGIDGADELVRLDVDIGEETRQIVAGLRQHYELDELTGQRVIVLVNLEAATLFGVESDGMVLAAGENADLLTTVGGAEPGEQVL